MTRKNILGKTMKQIAEQLWSSRVKTHWHPKEGLFTLPAVKLARTLRASSTDSAQAIRRLSFYINRAGKNLSAGDRSRLYLAKVLLEKGST